tara:strand:- start:141 stop:275 length:135 start_codon:yes stop_codon:yes gene_type:complete
LKKNLIFIKNHFERVSKMKKEKNSRIFFLGVSPELEIKKHLGKI